MHGLLPRKFLLNSIISRLETNPAVALLGARQVGKSTLAHMVLEQISETIYLDLERPADLNKLHDPEAFFAQFPNKLICLDEIQRSPELFPILRGVIDRQKRNSQFLILGSASRDLIQQSSESLAGRLAFMEIPPFLQLETPEIELHKHWLRGGYPRSLLARDNITSIQWREDYIRTFLERDIPQLGFNIPANTLHRFWQMLAHSHGQILNSSKLADSMGVSSHTIRKYIDLLEQTFVVRTLQPFLPNLKKRLIKSPKVYIRDSGLLHALLGIDSMEDLFAHPAYGSSFEGFCIENIVASLPRWKPTFFRTSNGAEIDLVLTKGQKRIAVEIKSSTSPKPSKGFWSSIESIGATSSYVVAPINEPYPLGNNVIAMPLFQLISALSDK